MGDYERQPCRSIGIHLGTKFSSICVWRVRLDSIGLLKIIRDPHGNERIPNFVAFTDSDEILIGQEAKDQVLDNLPNTIFDLKRLIGRKFTDPTVQSSTKFWPFKVVCGNHDKAMIVVKHKGIEKRFSPEEILSLILMKLKDIAIESGLKIVKDVVITVPTFFNDSQRQATTDAAKLAGLNVLRLINESSAVAYSYGYYKKSILVNDVEVEEVNDAKAGKKKKKVDKNLMVFYLGSGCLDVSMFNVNEEWTRYEVIGVAGDTQLGENDFDRGIVCHCLDDIKRQKRMEEIKNTDTRMRRLINACDDFNQKLGTNNNTYEIDLDSFYPDESSFTCNINRSAFEVLIGKLFESCKKVVYECLYVSKITGCYDMINDECNYVHEVILAGAGSQLIRPLLEEIFNGKKWISEGIDPYSAVVQGAAIEAAILSGFGAVGKFDDFSLFEVTPSRLAIDDPDITLVPRNTKFPGKFSTSFTSSINRGSGCSIGISEIEREGTDSKDYHRLGKFDLHTEPPSSAVVPLELGCAVDINRIFSISHIKDKNLKHRVTWGSNTERFTAEEMDDMLRTAEEIRTAGKQVKRGKELKRILEMFVHEFFPEHGGSVLCKDLDPDAKTKIQEVAAWLLARGKQVLTIEDYNSKFNEIIQASPGSTEFFNNVVTKCTFKDRMKEYLDCLQLHADYYDPLLHEKLIRYSEKHLKWVDSDQLFAAAEYQGRWLKFFENITSYEFAKKS